jgi:hypothetical protein
MWAWIVGTKNGLPLVYSPMYRIHSIDVPDTYTIPAEWWHGQSNTAGYGRYYNPSSTPGNPYNSNYSYGSGCGNNSNSGNGHVVWDNQFGPIGSSSDLINRPIFGHEDLRREMREVTSFGIEVNVISISLGIVGFELVEYGKDVNLFFFATTPSLSFYLGKTNSKNPKNYNGLFLSGNLGLDGLSFTRSVGMEFDNRGNFRNTGVETSYWGIGTNQGIGYSFSYYYNLGKL